MALSLSVSWLLAAAIESVNFDVDEYEHVPELGLELEPVLGPVHAEVEAAAAAIVSQLVEIDAVAVAAAEIALAAAVGVSA